PSGYAGAHLVVSQVESAPAVVRAGRTYLLRGTVLNEGSAAARGPVVVHLVRTAHRPLVVGRSLVRLGAHSSVGYMVRRRLPRSLERGSYALLACTMRAGFSGNLGCATAARHLQIGRTALPRVAGIAAAPPTRGCSSGAHSLSPFGAHVYSETGNGRY